MQEEVIAAHGTLHGGHTSSNYSESVGCSADASRDITMPAQGMQPATNALFEATYKLVRVSHHAQLAVAARPNDVCTSMACS